MITDPLKNSSQRLRKLEQCRAFGGWELALAAYNAGPGTVRRYGGLPSYDKTRSYVIDVLHLYETFRIPTQLKDEVRR